jgi:hypothetical protein
MEHDNNSWTVATRAVRDEMMIRPSGGMISVRNQAPHHFPDLSCVESSTLRGSLSQQKNKSKQKTFALSVQETTETHRNLFILSFMWQFSW